MSALVGVGELAQALKHLVFSSLLPGSPFSELPGASDSQTSEVCW